MGNSVNNAFGINESVVHARAGNHPYRAGMGMFSSAEWIVFFDDFTGDVASNIPVGWDAAIIDTGCTVTNANLAGGVALFDSDADNEGAAIYLPKSVQLNGKKFFMECRAKMEDVSAMTFQIGLSDLTAVTNPEDIWTTTTTDYIAFGNLDAATVSLTYDKNNGGTVTETNTDTTAATLSDDTYFTLGLSFNGASTLGDGCLKAYVNGKEVASALTEAQVPDDLPLAPFIGMLAGHATTADVAHVDYFRFAVHR
jgi:hypothetical protein